MGIIEALQQAEAGALLTTFIVSMMPVLELRGAIPLGVSMGLSHWVALVVSIAGNMIPVPFIILFIRKIFTFIRSKSERLERFIGKIEQRTLDKKDIVYKYQVFGLLIFVAIPLPGTGAWTGALLAALLNIRMKNAVPAIFAGVVIAGFLIMGLTYGFTSIF